LERGKLEDKGRWGKKKCSFGADSTFASLVDKKTTASFSVFLNFSSNAGEDSLLDGAARFGHAWACFISAIIFGCQVGAYFRAANGRGDFGSSITLLSFFNYSVTANRMRSSRGELGRGRDNNSRGRDSHSNR